MASRKGLSGSEYKKIIETKQKYIDKQVKSFKKFLLKPTAEIQQTISEILPNKIQKLVLNDNSPSSSRIIPIHFHLSSSEGDQMLNDTNCLHSSYSNKVEISSSKLDLISDSDTKSTNLNISSDENVDGDSTKINKEINILDDPSYWP